MRPISTYRYERIGRKELRLCRFLQNGSEISAELRTFPFRDQPPEKYIALSYSWEENATHETYGLHTDQKPLRISGSLKDFIKELGARSSSDALQSYWWIDSICINQDDSVEKGKQVQRMRDIYQQAHEVIVWLGKESGSSGRARAFIEDLSTWRGSGQIKIQKPLRGEHYRREWEDLKNFFDRAWWTRVWTVQECSIPSEIEYWCGPHTISRKSIFQTLEIVYDVNPPGFMGTIAFHHAWNRRRAWQINTLIRDFEGKGSLSLPALAAYFCDTEVTFDRDRLYGFAALATEPFKFEPDFNSSTDDVYLRFTRSFIDYHKSLDIILFAALFTATPGSLLPSWVPDWRRRRQPFPTPLMVSQSSNTDIGNLRPPRFNNFYCAYHAAGNTKPKYGFDITRLLAWGCVVDEVDEIAGSHNGDRIPSLQQLQLDDAAKSAKSRLLSICRSLTLNRKDRYLRKPMPEEWFDRDFIQLCLHLNYDLSPHSHIPQKYQYSNVHAASDIDDSDSEQSDPVIPVPIQAASNPVLPDDFKQWFKSTQSLHIGSTTFGAILRTLENEGTITLTHQLRKQWEHDHSSFFGRFCDTTKTMGMRLMTTCEPRKGMASSGVQYKSRIGMAPPGALKGDLVCILFGCSVPVVLRKLERSDEYVLIGECFLDECMNGEALEGMYLDKEAREFRIV